jgi:proteasome lid subunit RPN8/RPN11
VRGVLLSGEAYREACRLAEAAYPEEACGFLLAARAAAANEDGRRRSVARVLATRNRASGDLERRYLIPSEDLARAEDAAEERGEAVVGFYHSHPDRPVRPSAPDHDHAWPWFTYLILSIVRGRFERAMAYELDSETARLAVVPTSIAQAGARSAR